LSIVLLEPPRQENTNRFEEVVNAPLSACLFTDYIASILKENNIETEIINAHLYDWSIDFTLSNIAKKDFSILCIHVMYQWEETKDIFNMLSTIKQLKPQVHINIYGYYPTFTYDKILEDFTFIDSVTVGEPEFTTLELARYTLSKQKNTVKINIPGLAFRNKGGDVVYHPRQPIQDLDLLPYPYRQDIDLYAKKGIAVYILGSRGCYGHCTFCYLNPFYGQGNNWRGRSAKNIFEEILKLYTEYSINNFYFSDANFLGPGKHGRRRAVTLAELILMHDININFGFECRVNDVEEHSLSMLVMAGLTNVFLGLESGDPESLSRFKKNTTVEGNKRAIQLLRDYGIEPTYGFIMFEPGSTLKSVRNNFEFLKETNIMTTPAVTAHLLHHKETILKGTPDYLSITNKTTCSNSFTNYEAFYKIRNPEAEAFSEVITNVCKKALSLLPSVHSCQNAATDTGINSDSLAKLNNILIALFEKTLSDFEKNNLTYNPDSIKKPSQELIHEIERAIK